jgi:nitroreductase
MHLWSVLRFRRRNRCYATGRAKSQHRSCSAIFRAGSIRYIRSPPIRAQLHELLVWRRDVRRFRTDALPPGTLEGLIRVSSLGPSVGLSQPWRFVIVDDPVRRRGGVLEDFEFCNSEALRSGHIGEDSSSLLGGLLVTTIGLAGYSRADADPAYRPDFFVYVDEFQSFTTLALANMLSEMRKYRLAFTVAHRSPPAHARHQARRPRQRPHHHLVSDWRRRCALPCARVQRGARGGRPCATTQPSDLHQAHDRRHAEQAVQCPDVAA